MSYTEPIQNALTGQIHDDKFVGSLAELDFYRVMPYNGTQKLFFDNSAQYAEWRIKTYVDWGLSEAKRQEKIDEIDDPFSFEPACMRTDFLSLGSGTRHVKPVDASDLQSTGVRHDEEPGASVSERHLDSKGDATA
jgi:hypothetical protein